MLTFSDPDDPRIASLPPPYRAPVLSAIRALLEISRDKLDLTDQGFVAYIEPQDTPGSIASQLGKPLTSIEGTYRDGPCLVGVLLWGNSGAGITVICPNEDAHAPDIVTILRRHL